MKLSSIVIDSDDATKLAGFYEKFLGWEKKVYDHGENGIWITLRNKEEGTTRMVFQEVDDYQRPVWPEEKDKQQQMIHMDFYSDDVENDVERALKCGASLATFQSGDWKVLIDPAGHPFCIVPTRKGRMN